MKQDYSRVPELLEIIDRLTYEKINVGILGKDGRMLMIASVHEFGTTIDVTPRMRAYLSYIGIHLRADTHTITIPERSFIRAGYDANKLTIQQEMEQLIKQVLNFEISVDAMQNFIGERAVGLLQEYLTDLRSPGLSDITVERKGSSNPLIDNGQLRQSIEWEVSRV